MKRTRAQLANWLFALLVLAALPYSGAQAVCAAAAISPALRFGQTLVLADFDNDGQLDRARLASAGLQSSVEIRLGLTGPSSWLHFDNRDSVPGSLLSQDLDFDGDTDLIWTDRLHERAVIVWMGDGTGRFERVGAEAFAQDFVPGGISLTEPDEDSREQASDDETNSPVALETNSHRIQPRAPASVARRYDQGVLPVAAARRTTSRGPPSLFI
jgi:hypothetical protein